MLRIPCPYCGLRDQDEFRCAGEASRAPAADSTLTDDQEWAHYLFYRDNTRGAHRERWLHESGCKQWFNLLRDTLTHEILAAYRIGDAPPGRDANRD